MFRISLIPCAVNWCIHRRVYSFSPQHAMRDLDEQLRYLKSIYTENNYKSLKFLGLLA